MPEAGRTPTPTGTAAPAAAGALRLLPDDEPAGGQYRGHGGKSGDGSNSGRNGGAGTIYLKAAARQNGDLILDNAGIGTGSTTTVPGTAYASVSVRGGAKIAMTGSFSTEEELVLTGSSLNVSGALTLPGNLTLSNSTLSVGGALALPGRSDVKAAP